MEAEEQRKFEPEKNEIISHCWLNEGVLAILTRRRLYLLKTNPKDKKKYIHQEFRNPGGCYTTVTPFVSNVQDGFIAAGEKKTFHVYLKKMDPNLKNQDNSEESSSSSDEEEQQEREDKYYLKIQKKEYEFLPGINEPINSEKQPGKSLQTDRSIDFNTVICLDGGKEVIASTMTNDLIKFSIDPKLIDREPIEYVISPFHADDVVGLDCCINKEYIITCSKDKTVKLVDDLNDKETLEKGINIFDLNNEFYTDQCFPYSNGENDIPLNIRKQEFSSIKKIFVY